MHLNELVINGRFLTQSITGVQRYGRELLSAIDDALESRSDLRVRLLTPRLESPVPRLRHILHEQVGRLTGHAWEQIELPRYVGSGILFCPGNLAPFVLLGRSRVVVTVHDLSYLYYPDAYGLPFRLFYGLLVPQILRKATAVITVSASERRAITQHYPRTKNIVAIQNGALPGSGEQVQPIPSTECTILYVGSLSLRKNLRGLLEVSKRLTQKRSVRFVLVGGIPPGLSGSISNAANHSDGRIHFTGQINDWAQLRILYQSATCFFFPSFYEASPLPPVEAMGCGLPVVASRIPSLLERCGDAAAYCDPHSIDDMVLQLERVLDDPQLQADLRTRGYERAAEFTWKNCAINTLDVLTKGFS